MGKKDPGRPSWVRFSGIGIEFAGAVAGFTLIGNWIDRHYDCGPWGVVIGAALGLIGGMYNMIHQSLAASRDAARKADDSRRAKGDDRP
ncbi:MAG: AtpZ/AtpI family protein [Phycisphaerales bacterium]|nr:AtpZ/AtpI family protein [Phycisphaerales bacterium]